jgi:two-component system nitrate/nitrite sensor histidine kinase NarX
MSIDTKTVSVTRPGETAAGSGLLAQITAELAAGSDLHELLGHFLRPIMAIAGAQAGAVRVLDPAGQRMLLIGDVGLPRNVVDAERSMAHDCGTCGSAALHDRPVWADDLTLCSQRNPVRFFSARGRRMLALPLHHRARVLGIYNLFYDDGREPAAGVMPLLGAIGNLLGLALHHAQLEREHLRATLASERQMVAAEVHDALAQSLTYVKMRLPLLHDAMLAHDDTLALKYWRDIRGAVSDAHTSLREVLADLHTRVDPRGLRQALRDIAASFEERTGIGFELVDRLAGLELTPERQAQAFLIVQEALTNAARHSLARNVRVILEVVEGIVHLRVEDNGTGFVDGADALASTHYGIEIMRARARRLGGSLELHARPGGGTCVHLAFPSSDARAPH